jgi:protein-disulfide isomerase
MRGGGRAGPAVVAVKGYPAGLKTGSTPDGAPWIGGANAKVTIVEFSDFACPFCTLGAKRMKNLLEIYGTKIKLVFRQMPIVSLHPDSFRAAEAALAAHAQGKFWQMHDLLYANPNAHSRADLIKYARKLGLNMARFLKELDARKYKKKVQADLDLGSKKNIEGTPTFFVNGYKVTGLAPMKDFKKLIGQHLK